MMRSFCSDEELEDEFFDTREDITSVSDSGSECPENSGSTPGLVNWASSSFQLDVWTKNPESVQDRRHKFFKKLGINVDSKRDDFDDPSQAEWPTNINRILEDSGAVLANSDCGDVFSSSRSSMSCWSSDIQDSSEGGVVEVNYVCRIKNLDDGTEFVVDQLGHDGLLSRLREVGSNRLVSFEEFQRTLGLSPWVQQFMRRESNLEAPVTKETKKVVKKGWLRKLGTIGRIVNRVASDKRKHEHYGTSGHSRIQSVRVRQRKKHSKEFSALYMGQEIQAHEGSILTMKFSPDGHYLASAGEDRIVRVWQVMESERSNDIDLPDTDPSSMYFTINQFSELAPFSTEKGKTFKFKSLGKTLESVCVIFPPKVFRLSETPLHQFRGHTSEILDLSWSKNKYLLSSSGDKTVRLWKVGCEQCLKVFRHNNYVTCVQFNPFDDNYFISGSIDGKVRIWAIPGCEVVDWTDIRDIVTAVCYRPDGKGAVVGSMTGSCRFYEASDNHLQLDAQMCLQGKKKSPGKRITGFQFSPNDPTKLMITSADSHIRILDGVDVIHKYRGLRNPGSQISASFTLDGKHIVSASEDSNVYVWNYNSPNGPLSSQVKSIHSCERFFSSSVSVAVPWYGMRYGNYPVPTGPTQRLYSTPRERYRENGKKNGSNIPFSSPDCFSVHHGLFSEALPKGSATWPEEKLLISSSLTLSPSICKSQYRFLKSSCQSTFTAHAWGLVIVTAGFDGRIRSFINYGLPVV